MNNPYIQDGYLDVAALLGIDRNELRYATYSRADFDEEIFYLSQDFATAQMLDKLNLNTLYSYTENLFFHIKNNDGRIELNWLENWATGIENMLLQSGAITEAELDQWWDEQDWLDQPSWESPAPLEPQPPVITELSESHINKLVELYIGYFGRAVESAGLDYHQNHLLQMLQSGLSEYEAFNEVAKGFWVSALQYDTVTGYDETMSSFDFIAKVYANVLGRPDAIMNDLEGINGWVQVMEQGHDQGEMVLKILDGAHAYIDQNPTENVSLYVNNLLENRTEISLFFAQDTVSGGLLGTDAIHLGVDVMNRIDHTQESVAQVKNALLNGTLYDLPEIELVGASVITDDLLLV